MGPAGTTGPAGQGRRRPGRSGRSRGRLWQAALAGTFERPDAAADAVARLAGRRARRVSRNGTQPVANSARRSCGPRRTATSGSTPPATRSSSRRSQLLPRDGERRDGHHLHGTADDQPAAGRRPRWPRTSCRSPRGRIFPAARASRDGLPDACRRRPGRGTTSSRCSSTRTAGRRRTSTRPRTPRSPRPGSRRSADRGRSPAPAAVRSAAAGARSVPREVVRPDAADAEPAERRAGPRRPSPAGPRPRRGAPSRSRTARRRTSSVMRSAATWLQPSGEAAGASRMVTRTTGTPRRRARRGTGRPRRGSP